MFELPRPLSLRKRKAVERMQRYGRRARQIKKLQGAKKIKFTKVKL